MSIAKDIVENPHKVYLEYFHNWNFLLDSYEGGVDYTQARTVSSRSVDSSFTITVNGKAQEQRAVQTNLFKHPKEREEDYIRRVQMSYYYNFCAPIIDIYTDHLFKQPVIEDFGSIDSMVDMQKENIDRKNGSIGEFRKQVAECAQVYGHVFVLVDSPQIDKEIFSLQDKIDNGAFPYYTLIPPQKVINWQLDKFGRPHWVMICEQAESNIDAFAFDKSAGKAAQYRLWTRQEWVLYDSDYKEVSRGTHGLGVVPIVCVFDSQSKKEINFLGISTLADIAYIARDVYNSSSELKQILNDQTFSILAFQGDASDYPTKEVGTNKGIVYPRESNPPQYVTPPPGPAETLMTHIDKQITNMFRLAKLEGGSASFNGQSAVDQSGVSKAWDFNQTNSALSSKAANLEDAEDKMWQIWAKWEGKEFDGSVSYPDEFSIQSLNEDLEEAEKILKLSIGSEVDKGIKKAIVKKKFPRASDEDLDKMLAEVDAGVKTQGQRLVDRIPGLPIRNANSGGNGGLQNAQNISNGSNR